MLELAWSRTIGCVSCTGKRIFGSHRTSLNKRFFLTLNQTTDFSKKNLDDLDISRLVGKPALEIASQFISDSMLKRKVDKLIIAAKEEIYAIIKDYKFSNNYCNNSSSGGTPDDHCLNSVDDTNIVNKRVALQKAVHEKIKYIESKLPACNHLYNVIIRACIMINDATGIKDCIGAMKRHGLTPDINTFNILIEYYRSLGHPLQCEKLLSKMIKTNIKPDHITYSTLLAAFGHPLLSLRFPGVDNLAKAEHYFQKAEESFEFCEKPGHIVQAYNTLLEMYISRGMNDKVHALMMRMKSRNQSPNLVTFKLIVKSLLTRGMYNDAWILFMKQISQSEDIKLHDFEEMFYNFLPQMINPVCDVVVFLDMMISRFGEIRVSPVQAAMRYACIGRVDEEFCCVLLIKYVAPNMNAHLKWIDDNMKDFRALGWTKAAECLMSIFDKYLQ